MTHHYHDVHKTIESSLSFDEKFIKLLQHWIKHNDDHAATYRNWAQTAAQNDISEAGTLLEEAARITQKMNEKFEAAIRLVKAPE